MYNSTNRIQESQMPKNKNDKKKPKSRTEEDFRQFFQKKPPRKKRVDNSQNTDMAKNRDIKPSAEKKPFAEKKANDRPKDQGKTSDRNQRSDRNSKSRKSKPFETSRFNDRNKGRKSYSNDNRYSDNRRPSSKAVISTYTGAKSLIDSNSDLTTNTDLTSNSDVDVNSVTQIDTTPKITFDDLGLSQKTLEAVKAKGFEIPTDIQALTIPVMLKNTANIIAQARTGTGKTAAFGLPLMDMIDTENRQVQALVLAPTRELSIQVAEEIHSLKGNKDIRVVPIYGGQSIEQQLRRLARGVHIVVGTPGRIIDHLTRKSLKIDQIDHLILDEADEMLNMGFVDDMEKIMAFTKQDKKTLLFSATMPRRIRDLAKKYMDGHEFLKAREGEITTTLTDQIYFEVKRADKFEALCRIIDIEDSFYGLIFCRTKMDVDSLTSHLIDRGYTAEAIHGDISQAQRERTLDRFKKKHSNIMVATDVAARGIDVVDLTHVINFTIPFDTEAYIHRIGRTGRAGKQGTAITFVTPSEYRTLMNIQRAAGTDIRRHALPKVEDIIRARKLRINKDISDFIDNKEGDIDSKYYKWAKTLLNDQNPTEIVAALLNFSFEEQLNPNAYDDIKSGIIGPDRGRDRDRGGQNNKLDPDGKARLFVARGKRDGMNPRKLVDFITEKVNIKGRQISDIQVMDKFSFITVPYQKADQIIKAFMEKSGRPLITHAKSK